MCTCIISYSKFSGVRQYILLDPQSEKFEYFIDKIFGNEYLNSDLTSDDIKIECLDIVLHIMKY